MIGSSTWGACGGVSRALPIHGATVTGGALLGGMGLTKETITGIPMYGRFRLAAILGSSSTPPSVIGVQGLGGGSMKEQAKQNAANGSVALSALAAWASAEYGVPMEVVAPLLTALGVWARGLVS